MGFTERQVFLKNIELEWARCRYELPKTYYVDTPNETDDNGGARFKISFPRNIKKEDDLAEKN